MVTEQRDIRVLSEHRRRVVEILGETVILTVKYEPIRAEHNLLPYYAIFQLVRNGRLVDEDDGPELGHTSWEDAFATITTLAYQTVKEDHAADGASP